MMAIAAERSYYTVACCSNETFCCEGEKFMTALGSIRLVTVDASIFPPVNTAIVCAVALCIVIGPTRTQLYRFARSLFSGDKVMLRDCCCKHREIARPHGGSRVGGVEDSSLNIVRKVSVANQTESTSTQIFIASNCRHTSTQTDESFSIETLRPNKCESQAPIADDVVGALVTSLIKTGTVQSLPTFFPRKPATEEQPCPKRVKRLSRAGEDCTPQKPFRPLRAAVNVPALLYIVNNINSSPKLTGGQPGQGKKAEDPDDGGSANGDFNKKKAKDTSGGLPVREESMKEEWQRLASFQNVVLPKGLWAIKLAAAGFYLVGRNAVRCAFCVIEVYLSEFEKESPMAVHRRQSESCPFLLQVSNNVTVVERSQKIGCQYLSETERRRDKSTSAHQHNSLHQKPALTPETASSNTGSSSMTANSGQLSLASATANVNSVSNTVSTAEAASATPASSQTGNSIASVPSARAKAAPPSVLNAISAAGLTGSAACSNTTSGPSSNIAAAATPSAHPASENSYSGSASPPSTLPPSSPPSSAVPLPPRQTVTYAQLGIYTEEPKRPDFAIASARVGTFSGWPHSQTHPPEEMAEAGFYHVEGQGDLVRCFYCKGGLKTWSSHLRPWVEHARFFPKCPFVGQAKGQEYVNVVQELKAKQETISESKVEEELLKRLTERGTGTTNITADPQADDSDDLTQTPDFLESENQSLTDTRTCKICQTNAVSILFLPCGHLISCAQCAPALRTCAICRHRVKGRVRVIYEN